MTYMLITAYRDKNFEGLAYIMLTTVRDWYGLEGVLPCVRNMKCVVRTHVAKSKVVTTTGISVSGMNTSIAPSVDTEHTLTNSKIKKRTSKSRPIINDENRYWCDAYKCDECPVRFQCFTSRGEIETDKEVDKWKLLE